MRKLKLALLGLAALCMILPACNKNQGGTESGSVTENSGADNESYETQVDTSSYDTDFSKRDVNESYAQEEACVITFTEDGATVNGTGASASGADVTVTGEGTYIFSGSCSQGSISVEAGDVKIQLVFSGLTLHNENGPALYIASADKVFVTLEGDNELSDGASYTVSDEKSELDAAVFSRADLTFNGSGSLTVNGNYKHGIVSKDDLVIAGGTYTVTANNVALNGKDCVKIENATLNLTAGSDGIRSSNDEDEDKGFIYIAGGTFNITAENDGIQAETVILIDGGDFTIKTGGGSSNASSSSSGGWNSGWGWWGGSSDTSTSEDSAKGIKAVNSIVITAGTFNLDTSDDSIHTNCKIEITSGTFNIASGDDGIHADDSLTVAGGNITITKSYEGLEATDIVICGGTIDITSSDDGLNAAGGADSSAMGGRPGMGSFTSSSGTLTISGGYIVMNASGDGVDSNGTLEITGGIVLVSGPTNSANGAIDYETSGTISGGTVIAIGASGMAESFTSCTNQAQITANTNSGQAGTTVAIVSSDGTVICSMTAESAFNNVVVSAPGIESGSSYKIVLGGTVANADANGYATGSTVSGGTTAATVTASASSSSGGGMGGGMQSGGNKGGRGW